MRRLARRFFAVCSVLIACPAVAAEPAPAPFAQEIPGTDARIEMVPIPGGTFLMGSPPAEAALDPKDEEGRDEGPQFEVAVEPFYMAKYELTWDAYEAFSGRPRELVGGEPAIHPARLADAVTYPSPRYDLHFWPYLERMGHGPGYPAVGMSEYAAKQFTKWLSKKTGRFYRLPTESEWEYACRAGTTTAYHFGDDPAQLKNYGRYFDNSQLDDGDAAYHKVGQKKPNPWGLYDMHGNVAELVIDAYEEDWYARFKGRRAGWHEAINWPAKPYPRLARGGSYESEAVDLRSARRLRVGPEINRWDPELPKSPHWWANGLWVGFRVVSPAKDPPEAEKARWWDEDNDRLRQTLHKARAERQVRELIEPPVTD